MKLIIVAAALSLLGACQTTSNSAGTKVPSTYAAEDLGKIVSIVLDTCVENMGDIEAVGAAARSLGGTYQPDQTRSININGNIYQTKNYAFLDDEKFVAVFSVVENATFCTTAFPQKLYDRAQLLEMIGANMFEGTYKGAQVGYIGVNKLPLFFVQNYSEQVENDMIMVMDKSIYEARRQKLGSPEIK
ncbi:MULTISPECIES: hypothetical protein [Thalassospira]|uniref:Lipoprotein n=1 Tax=Thalassospira profundimaris TaxID=502049 RepID=A0A367VCI3_9PROT|nr:MULTISPECIES: hypothetical protein [Thalassospira]KZB73037.1 hypothetical protein AUQ43_03010 [Thalassospira sp. MCCC 1A01148]MBC45336.1 hypothetical protein [Thalassospira sp.]RCK22863.1 hypothetical protein TH6_07345 [Thalassospira profundimaris]|tara:strand:+ start:910 stop:1473 length:564 start_codon:yes stop_codon:yes gene_type:complete